MSIEILEESKNDKFNKLLENTKIIDLEEGEESLLSSLEFLSTSIDPPTKKRPSPDTPENIKRQYGRWKWNLKLDKKKGIIITENQKGSKRIKRSKKKKKEKPCRGKSKNRDKKHSFGYKYVGRWIKMKDVDSKVNNLSGVKNLVITRMNKIIEEYDKIDERANDLGVIYRNDELTMKNYKLDMENRRKLVKKKVDNRIGNLLPNTTMWKKLKESEENRAQLQI